MRKYEATCKMIGPVTIKDAADGNLFRLGCQSESVRGLGWSPRWGVREETKPHVSKTKNRTKKNTPANLTTFEESWIFGRPKRPFWTAAAPKPDMMWYEILCPPFSYSTLRIFYVEMAISEWGGGGGLHIRSWETTKMLIKITILIKFKWRHD